MEFGVIEWKEEKKFEEEILIFQKIFLSVNLEHTFYSHILCDHSLDTINYLNSVDLSLRDLANFNIENSHCMHSRFNQFKGNFRHKKENGENFLLPNLHHENEILRRCAILLFHLEDYPLYSDLITNEEIMNFRKRG